MRSQVALGKLRGVSQQNIEFEISLMPYSLLPSSEFCSVSNGSTTQPSRHNIHICPMLFMDCPTSQIFEVDDNHDYRY